MSMSEGLSGATINGDSNVTPPGNALTMSAPATVEAFASFTCRAYWSSNGCELNFNPAFAQPSGFAMSAALGTAVGDNITIAEVTSAIPGYWGYKSTWGTLAWGNGSTELLALPMAEGLEGADPAPDAEALANKCLYLYLVHKK